MIPGDLPCLCECETRRCKYNIDGSCHDNATCERRTTADKEEEDEA